MHHDSEHKMSSGMKQCIEECTECHSICLETAHHCLDKGGKHAESTHIGLLLDCAEICQTSANFMLRGSAHHGRTCAVCAEICRACEKSCRSFGDDEMMQRCAETCRRCAESCERMAGAGASR
ncbi:MAG: four-helix bundle copper-binding protein [Gemmatimonadota bacterium]|nr:four-helix bundle copper-binding protein [Gemmatimonadota bacterium]